MIYDKNLLVLKGLIFLTFLLLRLYLVIYYSMYDGLCMLGHLTAVPKQLWHTCWVTYIRINII